MTLVASTIISIIVVALFIFGGQVPEGEKIVPDMSQPQFTDILLYWAYILLGLTIFALLFFAVIGFFKNLKESPKSALGSFFVLVALAALLIVTYVIGDGTLLNIPGYDGSDNNPGTLKMTDMWLYSAYVMLALTIGAIIITPLLGKRK